jgi:hypothetical protein
MGKFCLIIMMSSIGFLEAHIVHQQNVETEWKKENLLPFDELMITWNAARPSKGKYLFYVSVKTKEWSPWLLYATWGSEGQQSFLSKAENDPVRVYQDALEVMEGNQATGFQIRIVTEEDSSLNQVYQLHVYTNSDRVLKPQQQMEYTSFVSLDVPGISQMLLPHLRNMDLCSPTSTTAVTRYLGKNDSLDPVEFAQKSWDSGFDIFGNWVFNVAQSSAELGREWSCWVERLSGFDDIYRKLHQGTPVIVSVRGPLPGSALPYSKGHLIAVVGYDPSQNKVICMDPAFPSNEETHALYDLSDFIEAWTRRGKIAYVFSRSNELGSQYTARDSRIDFWAGSKRPKADS